MVTTLARTPASATAAAAADECPGPARAFDGGSGLSCGGENAVHIYPKNAVRPSYASRVILLHSDSFMALSRKNILDKISFKPQFEIIILIIFKIYNRHIC